MQTKRNWKLPLIILVGVFTVILMLIFGVQSYQNRAMINKDFT